MIKLPPVCGDCNSSTLHQPHCKENFRQMIRQLSIEAAIGRLLDPASQFHAHAAVLAEVFREPEFAPYMHSFAVAHPDLALALTTLAMGLIEQPAPGWACGAYHWNPDENTEFLNSATRDHCEICNRPRPATNAA